MSSFPDLMNDLLLYIKAECPTIDIAKTTKADFDEGITFPPTTEQVAKSAINIVMRKLNENQWVCYKILCVFKSVYRIDL